MMSQRLLGLSLFYQAASGGLLSLSALLLAPQRAVAVLTGAALMTANYWVLYRLAARALDSEKRAVALAIALTLKFVLIAGLLALLVLVAKLDGLGLIIGMSSLLLGIAAATVHASFNKPAPARSGAASD